MMTALLWPILCIFLAHYILIYSCFNGHCLHEPGSGGSDQTWS